MRRVTFGLVAVVLGSGLVGVPATESSAGVPPANPSRDFNGDGYADLAVGAQSENRGRGVVHVLYGSASGLMGTGSIVFGQDTPGVPGTARPNEFFGAMLAFGNFNGDAYDDLVVSTPWDDIGNQRDAGSVTVFRGTATGLSMNARTYTDAFGTAADDRIVVGDGFGLGLAVGDYDADGDDDIAVGVPFDDTGIRIDPGGYGKVKVLRHNGGVFSESDVRRIKRSSLPVSWRRVWNVRAFGLSLTTLRATGTSRQLLAVGIPGFGFGETNPGAVALYDGQPRGIPLTKLIIGELGLDGAAGYSVAAGDVNNDGKDDLVYGAPGANDGRGGIGVVLINGGAELRPQWKFTQASRGFSTTSNPDDGFGSSLLVVDAGTESYIYIGAPWKNIGGQADSGAVFVLVGHATGAPVPARARPIQDALPVRSGRFGIQSTALDVVGDGGADVVISGDGATVNGSLEAGAVTLYPSPDATPRYTGGIRFTQDTPGVPDRAEPGDSFGSTLAFL